MLEKIKELFGHRYLDWEEYTQKLENIEKEHWREEIRKENLKNKVFSG